MQHVSSSNERGNNGTQHIQPTLSASCCCLQPPPPPAHHASLCAIFLPLSILLHHRQPAAVSCYVSYPFATGAPGTGARFKRVWVEPSCPLDSSGTRTPAYQAATSLSIFSVSSSATALFPPSIPARHEPCPRCADIAPLRCRGRAAAPSGIAAPQPPSLADEPTCYLLGPLPHLPGAKKRRRESVPRPDHHRSGNAPLHNPIPASTPAAVCHVSCAVASHSRCRE